MSSKRCDPQAWIKKRILSRKEAKKFGIVRFQMKHLPDYMTIDVLQDELTKLGFMFVISLKQIVVFCHKSNVTIYR